MGLLLYVYMTLTAERAGADRMLGELSSKGPIASLADLHERRPTPLHPVRTIEPDRLIPHQTTLRGLLAAAQMSDRQSVEVSLKRIIVPAKYAEPIPTYRFGLHWERPETETPVPHKLEIALHEHWWSPQGGALMAHEGRPFHSFAFLDSRGDFNERIAQGDPTVQEEHAGPTRVFATVMGLLGNPEVQAILASELISIVHPEAYKPQKTPLT